MIGQRITSITFLGGVGVWAVSLALYLATIAPTLTWGKDSVGVDGGELLAAASTLGIPHPPGYPTYTLLLKLFASVVPVGDFAFRGNLLSAVLAASTVAIIYAVILRFCHFLKPDSSKRTRVVGAALGATVLAASPLFWSQAIITEVYTLNAFFIAALLLIAAQLVLRLPSEKPEPSWSTRRLVAFGFILGLGLGNHLSLLLVAVPLLVWLVLTLGWRRLASPWATGALILGLAIYVYLPIRAAQDPPINWGGADSLGGIAWMLSGRPYQEYVFGVPATGIPDRLISWLELLFSQFNPLGIFIGLMAIPPLLKRLPVFLWSSLASMAVVSAYSISYNTVDFEVFTIPAFVLFSAWVGVGFFWILEVWVGQWGGIGRYRPALVLIVLAFVLLPTISVILNYGSQNLRGDRVAATFAEGILDSVPDGSVLMSKRESSVFSLWYIRYVERKDRDVAPIAVPLLQFDWYLDDLQRRFPDRIPAGIPPDIDEAMSRIVEHNADESLVFFTFWNTAIDEAFDLETVEGVYQARPKRRP